MIFARRAALHAFVFPSRSDHSTYASDESRLFWSREKPEYPQFESHVWIKMAQVLESLAYICEVIPPKNKWYLYW